MATLNSSLRVLLVENHKYFVDAVVKEFLSDFSVEVVPSLTEAFSVTRHAEYDIYLVDYDLDDGKGSSFVKHIREERPSAKIIAISSHDSGNNKLLDAGANAVCSKMHFRSIRDVISSVGKGNGIN